jgi:hypothetical protein
MATVSIRTAYPVASVVGLYSALQLVVGQSAPVGAPIQAVTIAAGGYANIGDLEDDRRYVLYGQVNGVDRVLRFATPSLTQSGTGAAGPPGPPGPPGSAGAPGPAGQAGVTASDAVRGQPDRFARIVSAVVTFDGSRFAARNDALSRPTNCELVETDSTKIVFTHEEIAPIHVIDLPNVQVNENLGSVGIEGIARLSSDFKSTAVVLRQTRTLEDSASNPGDGASWVREKGGGGPFILSGLENVSGDFAAYTQGLANVAAAWRMSEASGAVLDDAIGANDGAVVGSVTYGVTGGLPSDGTDRAITTTGVATSELTFPLAGITQAAFSLAARFKCPPTATIVFRDNGAVSNRYSVSTSTGDFLAYQIGATLYATTIPWASVADDEWHTIVVTKNGSAVALYLDGVQVHTANTAGSVGIGNPLHFGRSGTSSVYSAITLSELVTYSRALTAQEAKNIDDTAVADGLLHVTHSNLGSTLKSGIKLTKQGALNPELVPGSVTATGFAVRFRDDAGAQVTVADSDMALGISRSVYKQPVDPTSLVVEVVVQKEQSWAGAIADLNPDGWLRLGEASGTSYNDEIGTNDGTAVATVTNGATGAVVGDANTAVTFDGAQGKIALANPVLTGQFSLGILAKITGVGSVGSTGYGTLLGAGGTGGVIRAIMVGPTTGALYVALGGSIFTSANGVVPLGEYAFIAVTWDGTTQRSYVNGQLIDARVTANLTLNQAFWLGARSAPSTNYSFKGSLDEFFWGKRAWSANEIQQLQATWTDTILKFDRSEQASFSFSARFETAAPPPEPEPDSPVPDPTPLPVGDVGGAVSANIPLTAYRAQLNADTIERTWVGRALPATQGARDAIELNGLPTFPNATSTNWKNWFCTNYGIDPTDGHQIPNVLGGGTPLYMNAAAYPIHIVDDAQPLRNPGVHDQDVTVPNWATTINDTIASMGGIPIPADALRDASGDRYVHIYKPSTHEIWQIYAYSPRVGSTEPATTTLELSGSPSNGGFFMNFDYADPQGQGTYFTQSAVPYNVTAAALKTLLETSKNSAGALLGASRSSQATLVLTGGPLNVAPITITWRNAFALKSVPMRVTDNFMNSGHVLLTYKNSDPWTGGNLLSITSPSIANASHHVVAKAGSQGGTATATGIELLPMIIDWWEYRAAYDAGIAAGDGTIAGADWDAPGTDMGHVLAFVVGNCATGAVYPAIRGDGTIVSADRSIPMQGSLWTLPLTATRPNIVTWHFLQPLFNTMQRYGWMWYDKTGGGCEFKFRRWGWPGQTVPFPGPPGMVLSSANYPVWMRQLRFHESQIIDPAAVLAGW